ncbi:MAG: hypothetical protein ACJ790_07325 [Myxococcaceae bacterium]
MIAQLAALVLAATPAFPPAQKVPDSRDLKFAEGRLVQISPTGDVVTLDVPAGQLSLLTADARVQGADQAASTVQDLKPGQEVRVYYRVHGGAQVKEIDVSPPKE